MAALLVVLVLVLLVACVHDSRSLRAARTSPAREPSRITMESWALCPLLGPSTHSPGVYGTDLGFTTRDPDAPDRLALLFGDTWARAGGACQYPVPDNDDLQAFLPSSRPSVLAPGPPTPVASSACQSLGIPRTNEEDRTSWRRIRLLAGDKRDEEVLKTGPLQTPETAFSDGKRLFTIYNRNELARCAGSRECPAGFTCSTDPAYRGRSIGVCAHTSAASDDPFAALCRDVSDCGPGLLCKTMDQGVCLSTSPFEVRTARGLVSPSWYRDDPRLGFARTMYIGARVSPERPSDYRVVQRFVTNRFTNVTARTIANFDEAHPDRNDYRPGTHTLLLWGRAGFFGWGDAQALPFLLHVPLADLTSPSGTSDAVRWRPRFFAGYDASGAPRWSDSEGDAEPVYGTNAHVTSDGALRWLEPEFDYANQMSVSFVAPLGRWIMLYGGDVPAVMIRNPATGRAPEPTYLQRSPGAIHLRTAPHPWGRLRADPLNSEGFSSPEPVLTRRDAAPYLACGEDDGDVSSGADMPGCILPGQGAPRDPTPAPSSLGTALSCVLGDWILAVQKGVSGNSIGRLYAPNVIDEWTEDVTGLTPGLAPDERAVEIYWNVSTWNPYQVVLVKTRLRGRVAK